MKLVKEILINHMKGQFTPGETLNIKDVIMCIQQESSVEIKDTIYRNDESVSGVCSLTLSLENIGWTGNGFYLSGDNRSILNVKNLHFSYEKGLFIIQGDNAPLMQNMGGMRN